MRKLILPLALLALVACREEGNTNTSPEFLELSQLQDFKNSFLQFSERDQNINPNPDLPESAKTDFEGLWVAQQKYKLSYLQYGYRTYESVYERTVFSIKKTEAGDYRISSCNSAENATVLTDEELALDVLAQVNIAAEEQIKPVNYTQMDFLPYAKSGEGVSHSTIETVYAGAFKVSATSEMNGNTSVVGAEENSYVPECIQMRYVAEHATADSDDSYTNDFSLLIGLPEMYFVYAYRQYAGNGLPDSGTGVGMYVYPSASWCSSSGGVNELAALIEKNKINAEFNVCGFDVDLNVILF